MAINCPTSHCKIPFCHSPLVLVSVSLCIVLLLAACKQTSINEQLMDASKIGWESAIEMYLDKGADVNAKNDKGITPLMAASAIGDVKSVKLLVSRGAALDIRANYGGWTALFMAALNGHEETVQYLIRAGADVNIQGDKRSTPLILACMKGHPSIALMLINAGANVNASTDLGYTALHGAAVRGLPKVARILIEKGADVNRREVLNNDTPLIYAAVKGNDDTVNILISAGAELDFKGDNGCTAYLVAKSSGHINVAHILQAAGANTEIGNDECVGPRKKVSKTEDIDTIRGVGDAKYQGNVSQLQKAAELGDIKAQYNLGVSYMNGVGVPQDDEQAFFWFRRSAENGLAYAQTNLATMYLRGKGTVQDYQEAAKW